MSSPHPPRPSLRDCLPAARSGSEAALGQLLEEFRPELFLLARQELDRDLNAKLSVSDVVQETLLEAWEQFAAFQGQTPDQFRAWLRQILVHNLADNEKLFRRQKRQASLEVPLSRGEGLAVSDPSPSSCARRKEEDVMLGEALNGLAEPARSVLILRHRERLPFDEIAQRLKLPSADAARKHWLRGVEKLRQSVGPTG